jgi:hypothetical protein
MDFWNYLEYAAWLLSAIAIVVMLVDMIRIDTTYDNELLTSSREGELELSPDVRES